MRWFSGLPPMEPENFRVAVAEDAAVGGHEPVATTVRGGGHAHDGLVEVDAAGAAVELGIAEAEDPPVRGNEPVAAAIRGGRHADDRFVQWFAAHGAVELHVAEGEHATVRGHLPVSAAVIGHAPIGYHGFVRWMLPVDPQNGMFP